MPTVTVIQPTIAEEKAVKIRCAAYCRVSSDSEDQLNSFMAQTRYYSQIFDPFDGLLFKLWRSDYFPEFG